MKKILTVPAKYGSRNKSRDYREQNSLNRDPDSMPTKESMRKKHLMHYGGKESAFSPAPLRRFLNKNVGRPWDKVYSEICEHADSRSVAGYNLRKHIAYYLELNVVINGKTVYYLPEYGIGYVELRKDELYIDHKDGLLKKYGRGKKYEYKFQAYSELPLVERIVMCADEYSTGRGPNDKYYKLELRNGRLFQVTWKKSEEHLRNYTPSTATHAEWDFRRYSPVFYARNDWRGYPNRDHGVYATIKDNLKEALKSDESYIKRMAELTQEYEQKRNKNILSPEEVLVADKRQRKL